MPKVKRFLNGPAKDFGQLEVKYIHGKSPTLFFYNEDGAEEESIDIAAMDEEGIAAALTARGIVRAGTEEAVPLQDEL